MMDERRMKAELRPPVLVLERSAPRIVHDVGEMVRMATAQGRLRVEVRVSDAVSGEPLPAVVHLQGQRYPANEPFEHLFESEFNAKSGQWSRELIWVEHRGYENIEVDYRVEVT